MPGFDAIAPGVEVILKLLKLAKNTKVEQETRSKYFSELISPLFEQVGHTHDLYNQLILSTWEKTLELHSANQNFIDERKPTPEQLVAGLTKIREDFGNLRSQDEDLRDAMRGDAQDIFNALLRSKPGWKEERRFLLAVFRYFLLEPGFRPEDGFDHDIAEIIRLGGITYLATPSSKLYLKLMNCQTPKEMLDALTEARHELNDLYMVVRRMFTVARSATLGVPMG